MAFLPLSREKKWKILKVLRNIRNVFDKVCHSNVRMQVNKYDKCDSLKSKINMQKR